MLARIIIAALVSADVVLWIRAITSWLDGD
jgi:hypothetical protein